MAVATFDTLKFANTLKATGLPENQAEALATAFADLVQVNFKDLVTKEEYDRGVKEIRTDIERFGKELRAEIDRVSKELRAEIDRVSKELRAEIDRVAKEDKDNLDNAVRDIKRDQSDLRIEFKHEIQASQAKHQADLLLLKWMVGVTMTGVVTLIGLFARMLFTMPR
jgi:hypothetical protein